MNILAFGASNSTTSINRQLALHAASLIKNAKVSSIDLSELSLPLYSPEHEQAHGIPEGAHSFLANIQAHDAVIISLAEHNGSYTAAFKNLLDWTSRIEMKLWGDKPVLLLSTSPGSRGGTTVLNAAAATFPHLGAKIVETFSLPTFHDHFSDGVVSDPNLAQDLRAAVEKLHDALTTS